MAAPARYDVRHACGSSDKRDRPARNKTSVLRSSTRTGCPPRTPTTTTAVGGEGTGGWRRGEGGRRRLAPSTVAVSRPARGLHPPAGRRGLSPARVHALARWATALWSRGVEGARRRHKAEIQANPRPPPPLTYVDAGGAHAAPTCTGGGRAATAPIVWCGGVGGGRGGGRGGGGGRAAARQPSIAWSSTPTGVDAAMVRARPTDWGWQGWWWWWVGGRRQRRLAGAPARRRAGGRWWAGPCKMEQSKGMTAARGVVDAGGAAVERSARAWWGSPRAATADSTLRRARGVASAAAESRRQPLPPPPRGCVPPTLRRGPPPPTRRGCRAGDTAATAAEGTREEDKKDRARGRPTPPHAQSHTRVRQVVVWVRARPCTRPPQSPLTPPPLSSLPVSAPVPACPQQLQGRPPTRPRPTCSVARPAGRPLVRLSRTRAGVTTGNGPSWPRGGGGGCGRRGLAVGGKTQRGWLQLPAVVGGGGQRGVARRGKNTPGGGGEIRPQGQGEGCSAVGRPRPARTRLTHAQPRPGGVDGGTRRGRPQLEGDTSGKTLAADPLCPPLAGRPPRQQHAAGRRPRSCVAVRGRRSQSRAAAGHEWKGASQQSWRREGCGRGGPTVRLVEPDWPQMAHAMAGRPQAATNQIGGG